MEKYSSEIRRIAKELINSISLNMGLEKGTFLDLHGDLHQTMRVNYYPPCAKPDQVIGFSPHSDISTITVLSQEEDITALLLRHNDQWVPVEPIPGALVVNVGDILEVKSHELLLLSSFYNMIDYQALFNPYDLILLTHYYRFGAMESTEALNTEQLQIRTREERPSRRSSIHQTIWKSNHWIVW